VYSLCLTDLTQCNYFDLRPVEARSHTFYCQIICHHSLSHLCVGGHLSCFLFGAAKTKCLDVDTEFYFYLIST
jgi:hypothetical protein